MALNCLPVIANDGEHLFLSLFAICMYILLGEMSLHVFCLFFRLDCFYKMLSF